MMQDEKTYLFLPTAVQSRKLIWIVMESKFWLDIIA